MITIEYVRTEDDIRDNMDLDYMEAETMPDALSLLEDEYGGYIKTVNFIADSHYELVWITDLNEEFMFRAIEE